MMPDPHGRLHRALATDAARYGLTLRLLGTTERPWFSATFAGNRLTVALAIERGDPAAWLAALPDAELTMPGGLVADLAVARIDAGVATLEVLILEA